MLRKKADHAKSMKDSIKFFKDGGNKKNAPHAVRIHGVTYINQRALLQNLEVTRDNLVKDYKDTAYNLRQELMDEGRDIDIRATELTIKSDVHNINETCNCIIDYIKHCVDDDVHWSSVDV